MADRRFRWFPHAGNRHAVRVGLVAGDHGETLCGVGIEVPREQPPRSPNGCWPTCPACDAAWRAEEGILPFPRPAKSSPKRPTHRSGVGASWGKR
ncbi:zinc finger protein [Umezawaea sp. Da 62-37]|uniref:zinc finger protein n=1 Tax=Umezawaea sp. Da 62-37 TaxID=3075927 RepID=UPI0028F708B7|nr:zinc finger protein [Umezawaea sp. Da 62-37]WNV82609.1 zinc finger protein [Umezawaea sp. Da 62-37]